MSGPKTKIPENRPSIRLTFKGRDRLWFDKTHHPEPADGLGGPLSLKSNPIRHNLDSDWHAPNAHIGLIKSDSGLH